MVGFAAETNSVEHYARTKLLAKNLDLIAANEVGHSKAFDCDDNSLLVLWRGGRVELPVSSKRELAQALTGLIVEQYLEQNAARERGSARELASEELATREGARAS
jgi:phosphopantothenoylcysteine decarboxylase/phosphopantothenate--cysteine ligase